MGKTKNYKPLTGKQIASIMANNPIREDPIEPPAQETAPMLAVRLRREAAYDTMKPEEALGSFLKFIREAQARYKEDVRLVAEYQLQQQDLEHYAEMADDLGRTDACVFYRKLRDIRRARRAVKNESQMLEPLMAFLDRNADTIKQLERVLGDVRAKKEHLDGLAYTAKTDILKKQGDTHAKVIPQHDHPC